MIRGVHAMLYTARPKEVRDFLREKIGLSFIDAGDGWLIFDTPGCEIGCHPLLEAAGADGAEGSGTVGVGHAAHEISFTTDDVRRTVAALRERGVVFRGQIENRGWGLAVQMVLPDETCLTLYQPLYR